MSLKAFAQQEDVHLRTLKWWRWKLGSELNPKQAGFSEDDTESLVEFHELEHAPSEPPSGIPSEPWSTWDFGEGEVALQNGRQIRLYSSCDPNWVARLVKALERRS